MTINFTHAIAADTAFKFQLQRLLQTRERADVQAFRNAHHCELGRWLRGTGKEMHGALPEFAVLVEMHDEFHRQPGQVAAVLNIRQYETAERLLAPGGAYDQATRAFASAMLSFRHAEQAQRAGASQESQASETA